MSVLARQTAAPANNIVSFSRGNPSGSSTPEAPTSSNSDFLANGVRAISALVAPKTLAAVCAFLLHFNRVPANYASYNHYKTLTREYVGELSGVVIRSSPQQPIGSKTIFSSAYTNPKDFLEAKINDTMERLEAARQNPESVRLKEEAREAIDTTMAVAYSEQNQAARDALSPEMQDNLATIGEQCGDVFQTVSVTRG